MNHTDICRLVEERKEELFSLLSELIKINSESFISHGNEAACAQRIHEMCKELELDSDIYSPLELAEFTEHPDYLDGRGLEDRYNVVARWNGQENTDKLMLMAHTDTVQIGDPKSWEFDPLSGEIKDGKIFGRGAGDDKYALATVLFLIKLFKEQGFVPKANLLFAAYSDEEYGGSHGALAAVTKYPCEHIVSLDGNEGQLWHCGSGGGEVKYLYRVKGTVNSARKTAEALPVILEEINTFAANRREELAANRFYKGTALPEESLRYMGVRAGYDGVELNCGEVYFVFYTDKTKEIIDGEFRELEERLAKRLEPLGIEGGRFVPQTRFFHYVFCEPDSEDVRLMLEASREATGKEPVVCGSCLSDLSVISKYGSSRAFGFGAGRDFALVGGAHQPNEFIECDKFVEYTKTIALYILKMLG
ncbi:MAG: M20 family metallopeptidase [Clostridia bacterium]|nr:M20 family metallopeptidase [Clostridia bacterium]